VNNAIILAAGLGSRLGDITKNTPKCLVPLNGRPMLQITIERLYAVGVREIVINTSYLYQQVEQFIAGLSYPGLSLKTSYEEKLLGTGGGIKKAAGYFTTPGDFYVHNADVFTNLDLAYLKNQHTSSGAYASIACQKVSNPRHLLFNRSDLLVGWANQDAGTERLVKADSSSVERGHYLCVQILKAELLPYFDRFSDEFSLFDPFLLAAEEGISIKAVWFDKLIWHDVGTPASLRAAQKAIEEGAA
jgi:NDP-sugar pyrophosphorylase family protein